MSEVLDKLNKNYKDIMKKATSKEEKDLIKKDYKEMKDLIKETDRLIHETE